MAETRNIKVNFVHPTDGRLVTVTLDESMTAAEAISELIANGFISTSPQGYNLAVKGGRQIGQSESFADAKVKDGDSIRIIPAADAGGKFLDTPVESAIPGLRKGPTDTFTVKDIQSSPQAIIMIVHMYDNLQLKYEQQSKQLEYERARSNDRFVATLLLLISQVVLSIGTNLLTSNSVIAIPVLVAGILQSALAVFLTFRKRQEP
jgi:DUF4097 and DUF4098 domain-containing protein YvlB